MLLQKVALSLIYTAVLTTTLFVTKSLAEDAPLDPVFSSTLDSSAPLFTQIMAELKQHEIARANFVQEKKLAALTRPLLSQGEFVFAKSYGVLWLQKSPFQSTLVLTAKGARFEAHDMGASQNDDNPAIRRVSELFISLFAGEDAALKEQFAVQVAGTPDAWQLGLVPHSSLIRKFLRAIVLKGDKTVKQVTVFEGEEDKTNVSLTPLPSSSALTPDEEMLFKS